MNAPETESPASCLRRAGRSRILLAALLHVGARMPCLAAESLPSASPSGQPAPPALTLSNLWCRQNADVVPLSGFAGTNAVSMSNDVACLRYAGPDGRVEYRWERPAPGQDGGFGRLTLFACMAGGTGVTVSAGTPFSLVWSAGESPGTSEWETASGQIALKRTFSVGAATATVRATGRVLGKSLALSVTCDQPLVRTFRADGWGQVPSVQPVSVPYYSGTVLFLPREDLFVNAFLDWTSSAASSHNQMQANYDSLTDGTLNRLQERAIFSAAWHPAEVFPNIPNPPSPFRGVLADRVIVDVWNWGLPFARIAQNIEALADYGLTNVLAVVHIWQRDGYDNGLPAHVPANAALGGDTGLSNLVARSLRLGIPVALHENYADCYPNYERFRTSSVP